MELNRITLDRGVAIPLQAQELVAWAQTATTCGFDVETAGTDPLMGRLRTIQVGDDRKQFILYPEHRALLAQVLRESGTPLAHNGLFDAIWIEHHLGVPMQAVVDRMIDTQVLGLLYDPRSAFDSDDEEEETWEDPVGMALKAMACRFVDPTADRWEKAVDSGLPLTPTGKRGKAWEAEWAKIPDNDPTFLDYGASDILLTDLLFKELMSRLTTHEREVLLPIEQRVSSIAYRIMRTGLLVDTDEAAAMRDRLLVYREGIIEELGGINPESSKQVVELLTDAGAPLTKRTKNDALSVDKEVLDRLSGRFPVAAKVRAAKQAKRMATTYAEKLVQRGPLIRPQINVASVRTGRWSVSEPPLQQWPKKPMFGEDLRSLFHAPEGQMLVSRDLSSIEFVVGAAVTEDENMLTAVGRDLDTKMRIYESLAEEVGIDRATAKTIILGGQYGAGAEKMSAILQNDDLAMVKRLKAQTFAGYYCEDDTCMETSAYQCDHRAWSDGFYPGPRAFRRQIEKAWEEGWQGELREGWPGIRNHYGRWVPARPNPRTKALTPDWFAIFNHTVQGSSRDLLMRMLIDAVDAGLTPWMTVHDEIIVVADDTDAADAQKVLETVMTYEDHPQFHVPIRSEGTEPSKKWGEQ